MTLRELIKQHQEVLDILLDAKRLAKKFNLSKTELKIEETVGEFALECISQLESAETNKEV